MLGIMELIRVYNPPAGQSEHVFVRKDVDPNAVISHEEHPGKPTDWCNVVTHTETFTVDITYDELTEKLKLGRIVDLDRGVM